MTGEPGSRFEIVARADFSDAAYLRKVWHPLMARAARPGQIVIVIAGEHGERIPLTIADNDLEEGTITLVIQAASTVEDGFYPVITAGKIAETFC